MKLTFTRETRPDVVGFDCETPMGDLGLIGCSDGSFYEPQPDDPADEPLAFLYQHTREWGVFYNVRFDFGMIVKRLLQSYAEKKDERNGVFTSHRIETPRYVANFVMGKGFTITYKGGARRKGVFSSRAYFDAANFYGETKGVDGRAKAALGAMTELWLKRAKADRENDVDRERIGSEQGYYATNRYHDPEHTLGIIPYCIRDAVDARDLMLLLLERVHRVFGFWLGMAYSPASISKAYIYTRHPDFDSRTFTYSEIASQKFKASFRAGIFDTDGVGFEESAWEPDIASAYPDKIRRLPELSVLRVEFGSKVSPDAQLGAYRIRFEDVLGLFPQSFMSAYSYTVGAKTTWANLPEVLYLQRKKVPFTILESC